MGKKEFATTRKNSGIFGFKDVASKNDGFQFG